MWPWVKALKEGNATEKMEYVMQRVTETYDATMPRKRNNNQHQPVYWWNNDIAKLRAGNNKARRRVQRACKKSRFPQLEEKYRSARLKLNKAIKRSKRQCWNELLSSSLKKSQALLRDLV